MKIGIFGGVFDPIHVSHLQLARAGWKTVGLDRLFFVPTGVPPHKNIPKTSIEERIQMVLLALGQESLFFELSTIETGPGPHYTVRTLQHFQKEFPEDELFYLIGEDSLKLVPNWVGYEEILRLTQFLVAKRTDSILLCERNQTNQSLRGTSLSSLQLPTELLERTRIVEDYMPTPISSTGVRALLKQGKIAEIDCIPEVVRNYLLAHNPYYAIDEIDK